MALERGAPTKYCWFLILYVFSPCHNIRESEVRPGKCAHLVYTSGTEGPSKGVMVSGDSLTYVALCLCRLYDMVSDLFSK